MAIFAIMNTEYSSAKQTSDKEECSASGLFIHTENQNMMDVSLVRNAGIALLEYNILQIMFLFTIGHVNLNQM